MTLTETPICNFGEKAKNFNLLSTENKKISLNNAQGENGTLIMFICNHCPYVKAVIKDIVEDAKYLKNLGLLLSSGQSLYVYLTCPHDQPYH